VNTLAAVGHMKYIRLLELEGTPIAPFPMPAKVLINHSRSLSHVPLFGALPTKDRRPAWRRYAGMLKRRAKLLPGNSPGDAHDERGLQLASANGDTARLPKSWHSVRALIAMLSAAQRRPRRSAQQGGSACVGWTPSVPLQHL